MGDDIMPLLVFLLLPACSLIISIISVRLRGPKVPLVGLKSIFEPRVVANFRFFRDSAAVIKEGYSKASFLCPVVE